MPTDERTTERLCDELRRHTGYARSPAAAMKIFRRIGLGLNRPVVSPDGARTVGTWTRRRPFTLVTLNLRPRGGRAHGTRQTVD